MNFWFWSRSKSPFFPKMAKFKPLMLLKHKSKASFNHWFMWLISQGTRIVKKVELGLRIDLLVVRYVAISPYFENRQIQKKDTRRYCITTLHQLMDYYITELLTVLLYYLLHYCITYFITVLLNCIRVLQNYCIIVLLYYCIILLRYYCITVLLYRIIVLLYYYIPLLLYYCTVLLCITVLLYFCFFERNRISKKSTKDITSLLIYSIW